MKATQLLNRRMKNIFYFDILLKLFLKEKNQQKIRHYDQLAIEIQKSLLIALCETWLSNNDHASPSWKMYPQEICTFTL